MYLNSMRRGDYAAFGGAGCTVSASQVAAGSPGSHFLLPDEESVQGANGLPGLVVVRDACLFQTALGRFPPAAVNEDIALFERRLGIDSGDSSDEGGGGGGDEGGGGRAAAAAAQERRGGRGSRQAMSFEQLANDSREYGSEAPPPTRAEEAAFEEAYEREQQAAAAAQAAVDAAAQRGFVDAEQPDEMEMLLFVSATDPSLRRILAQVAVRRGALPETSWSALVHIS